MLPNTFAYVVLNAGTIFGLVFLAFTYPINVINRTTSKVVAEDSLMMGEKNETNIIVTRPSNSSKGALYMLKFLMNVGALGTIIYYMTQTAIPHGNRLDARICVVVSIALAGNVVDFISETTKQSKGDIVQNSTLLKAAPWIYLAHCLLFVGMVLSDIICLYSYCSVGLVYSDTNDTLSRSMLLSTVIITLLTMVLSITNATAFNGKINQSLKKLFNGRSAKGPMEINTFYDGTNHPKNIQTNKKLSNIPGIGAVKKSDPVRIASHVLKAHGNQTSGSPMVVRTVGNEAHCVPAALAKLADDKLLNTTGSGNHISVNGMENIAFMKGSGGVTHKIVTDNIFGKFQGVITEINIPVEVIGVVVIFYLPFLCYWMRNVTYGTVAWLLSCGPATILTIGTSGNAAQWWSAFRYNQMIYWCLVILTFYTAPEGGRFIRDNEFWNDNSSALIKIQYNGTYTTFPVTTYDAEVLDQDSTIYVSSVFVLTCSILASLYNVINFIIEGSTVCSKRNIEI